VRSDAVVASLIRMNGDTPPADKKRYSGEEDLVAVAARQFGVFTREQAYRAGLSRSQLISRLASRQWVPMHPGVLIAATTPRTGGARAMAALLYAGEQAWFSHATAARLRGIDPRSPDPRIWITVPFEVTRSKRPGVKITRSRRIAGFTSTVKGLPTMDDARTIVDLARLVDEAALARVLYDVVSRNVVTVEAVLAAAEDFGGRAGIAMLRRIADEFSPDHESGLEHEADVAFKNAGIELEPQVEVWDGPILVARLDFAIEEIKLGIEIDGAATHSTPEARRYDGLFDRALRRRGWQVERFTTEDVRRTPQAMVGHVRAILQSAQFVARSA
jgi:hypothetical protein